jgi:acyl-CoA thioesterase
MEDTLANDSQALRTVSAVFAGQVKAGPIEIEVVTLRRGRSMSQFMATVRNPGEDAGVTVFAVFGSSRRGLDFTELTYPEIPGPEGMRSFRDPVPEGIDFEFPAPLMPFWANIVEVKRAVGRNPWEPVTGGPAEVAYWYRIDDPPLRADGTIEERGLIALCDMMPQALAEKIPEGWLGPSTDYTIHLFRRPRPGWLLAHNRCRHAGDGYASVDVALWDPTDRSLVAYATQVMFFVFF